MNKFIAITLINSKNVTNYARTFKQRLQNIRETKIEMSLSISVIMTASRDEVLVIDQSQDFILIFVKLQEELSHDERVS
jgi:hypothetical protein